MDPKRRKNALIVAALVSFGLFAGDRLVFEPLASAWDARAAEIAKLRGRLDKGELLLGRQDHLAETWRDYEDAGLPADQAAAEALALKSVDGWAKESGLTVASIKPRSIPDNGEWPKLEFRASARGSLESIARFVWLLETAALPLRVEELEIASHEKKLGDMAVNIAVSGLLLAPRQDASPAPSTEPAQEEF